MTNSNVPNPEAVKALQTAIADLEQLSGLVRQEIAMAQKAGKALIAAAHYDYGEAGLYRAWGQQLKRDAKERGSFEMFRTKMFNLCLSLIEASQAAEGLTEDEAVVVRIKPTEVTED